MGARRLGHGEVEGAAVTLPAFGEGAHDVEAHGVAEGVQDLGELKVGEARRPLQAPRRVHLGDQPGRDRLTVPTFD